MQKEKKKKTHRDRERSTEQNSKEVSEKKTVSEPVQLTDGSPIY